MKLSDRVLDTLRLHVSFDADNVHFRSAVKYFKTHFKKPLLPWAILAVHVLEECSDADELVILAREQYGFDVDISVVEQVLVWSNLGKATSLVIGFELEWMQNKLVTEYWRQVYNRHLGSGALNPQLGQPGLVFFALYKLQNYYTVLFIDNLTKAATFSPAVKCLEIHQLVMCVRTAVSQFQEENGQPAVMLCINPCKGKYRWIAKVVQAAVVSNRPMLTVFAVYNGPKGQLPEAAVGGLIHMTDAIVSRNLEYSAPFKRLKGTSPWELLFVNYCGLVARKSFYKHPWDVKMIPSESPMTGLKTVHLQESVEVALVYYKRLAFDCKFNTGNTRLLPQVNLQPITKSYQKMIDENMKLVKRFSLAPVGEVDVSGVITLLNF